MSNCVLCGNPASYGDMCSWCEQREYNKFMERMQEEQMLEEQQYLDMLEEQAQLIHNSTQAYLIQFDDDGGQP